MEQEFYRDEFEQLLKDTTEDFKMYPSRKVWHSIYNDLHPDRKWPSFAVCLLLLTIILYVGVSNNNSINNKTRKNIAVSLNEPATHNTDAAGATAKPIPARNSAASGENNPGNNILAYVNPDQLFIVPGSNYSTSEITTLYTDNNVAADIIAEETEDAVTGNTSGSGIKNATTLIADGRTIASITAPVAEEAVTEIQPDKTEEEDAASQVVILNKKNEPAATGGELKTGLVVNTNSFLAANKNIQKDTREIEWIEDFAFHNASNSSKKIFRGLATQFYVTPSVGYRVKFKNGYYKSVDNSLVTSNVARNHADKTELNQQATMNMEAGAGIIKNLGKRLRFKTGVQFNFTDYLTFAQKLEHPTQTNLLVDNQSAGLALAAYSADYAHIPGKNNSKLHNRTIQLSVPLGMDYKIISNNVLNWYVGASVQPTYVTRGNSYLLSSDYNFLVEDQALMRKWNLNGAIESFVSFKTRSGTFINLGPQFRYQLFSMYDKSYIYTEKPYSVGFKIGFTRPL
jgi:hypothetical protein